MLYEFDHQQISQSRNTGAVLSRTNSECSDEELMERIQARDERSLEILMKRYEAMLRSVVGRMLSVDHDITDVVEEVFLGLWNQASNFDIAKGKVIGWIITMARRRAIDRVRRCRAYDRAEMRFRQESGVGIHHLASDDVEKQAASADDEATFVELISKLPEAQRQAVHMAFYRGLSQREIARETGIPLGTIKTRLELGVEKLRTAVCAMGTRDEWLGAVA
jgi:RNA polymerase sigma-70 factor, ECF subfamily